MKYLSTAFFTFLAFNLPLFAQNWSPFNATDHYAYRLNDTDDIISNIFGIDSVSVDSGDSTYHFSAVLNICQNCPGLFYGHCFIFNRNYKFVQRTMQQLPGGTFKFEGLHDFTLNTLGSINDSWTFSESDTVTASIVTVSQEQVFSQLDSVKTIALSNGKTIKVSKNFGILQFPSFESDQNFNLAGILERGLGDLLPTYRDVYNYQVGDILQYYEREQIIALWGDSWPEITTYSKFNIIGKEDFADSTVYKLARKAKIINGDVYVEGETISYIADTITWNISGKSMPIAYPRSIAYGGQTLYNPMPNRDSFIVSSKSNGTYFVDSMATPTLSFHANTYCNYDNTFFTNDTVFAIIQNPPGETYEMNIEQKKGIGLANLYFIQRRYRFTHGDFVKLEAYVIGQESSGVINADTFYEAPTPLDTVNFVDSTFSFNFPNPTTGVLYFNFANFRKEVLELTVINALGQLILTQTINKEGASAEVDLSALPWGYYFIRIRGKEFSDMTKILKIE